MFNALFAQAEGPTFLGAIAFTVLFGLMIYMMVFRTKDFNGLMDSWHNRGKEREQMRRERWKERKKTIGSIVGAAIKTGLTRRR